MVSSIVEERLVSILTDLSTEKNSFLFYSFWVLEDLKCRGQKGYKNTCRCSLHFWWGQQEVSQFCQSMAHAVCSVSQIIDQCTSFYSPNIPQKIPKQQCGNRSSVLWTFIHPSFPDVREKDNVGNFLTVSLCTFFQKQTWIFRSC